MRWYFDISRRQAAIWTLIVAIVGAGGAVIISLAQGQRENAILPFCGLTLFALFLVIYLRSEPLAAMSLRALVVTYTIMLVLMLPRTYVINSLSLAIFTPSLLAFILLDAPWIVVIGIGTLVGMLLRANGVGPLAAPFNQLIYGACVAMLLVGSLVMQTIQRALARSADHLRAALTNSEAQAQALAQANQQFEQQIDQQRQLLDLVQDLETPAIPLAPGVLCAPIVGHIDARRAEALTTRLLQQAHERRMQLVVIDVTGVTLMDTAVTGALLNTAQALRLLGCSVTISGISASIALALTQLGLQLTGVQTARDVQEALAQHIELRADGSLRTNN